MARVVNEVAYAARRNAILDAAQQAIETKGYEQMVIADLLSELHISSGAFYHYFGSKPALLLALIDRIGSQMEQRVLPIIHDSTLNALDKFQRFFVMLDDEKLAHKSLVFAFLRVWYADENAVVRQKLYMARIKRLAPWLEEIIRQGVQEGVMTTPYPDQAARIVISLLEDLGVATAELFLAEKRSQDNHASVERITMATADALERVLGAPKGSVQSYWRERLSGWVSPPTGQGNQLEHLSSDIAVGK